MSGGFVNRNLYCDTLNVQKEFKSEAKPHQLAYQQLSEIFFKM